MLAWARVWLDMGAGVSGWARGTSGRQNVIASNSGSCVVDLTIHVRPLVRHRGDGIDVGKQGYSRGFMAMWAFDTTATGDLMILTQSEL